MSYKIYIKHAPGKHEFIAETKKVPVLNQIIRDYNVLQGLHLVIVSFYPDGLTCVSEYFPH